MTITFSSYIICATARSGSTMLCDLLRQAGAGRPDSFYRAEDITDWAESWGVAPAEPDNQAEFDRAYLAGARQEGSSENGIFGMRLMQVNLADVAARLARLYPDADTDYSRFHLAFGPGLTRYIHLSRQDKVAQAVSRVRAQQSGLWHMAADGRERERTGPAQELVYDAARIAEIVSLLESNEAGWRAFFASHPIEPIHLTYEELASDPHESIAPILIDLGFDPDAAAAVHVKTAKIADATSAEWVERFKRERGEGVI